MIYLGRPVFPFKPDWAARMAARQLDELRIESAGAGLAVPWSAGTAIHRRGEFAVFLEDRPEIADLVAFFADRSGRRKGFWIPTWLGDFRLLQSEAAGAATLTIEAVGLGDLIAFAGEQFRHIALIRGGVWGGDDEIEPLRIASVAGAGETEVLTLDGTLAAALDHRETLVCPLLYARASQDEITLAYRNSGQARAAIAITELPGEYTTARDGDAPVWLYEFTRGADTWRYADWGEDIERGGATWTAASIAHGAIRSNAQLLADPVEITAGSDGAEHPLRLFAEGGDLRQVEVAIYRADAGDTAVLELEIAGELIGRAPQRGGRVTFQLATPLAAGDNVPYPRTVYDRYDNRHVYDSGVTEATYTTAGTIAAVGVDWIEAAAFGAKATAEGDAQWFAYGLVRVGDETRLCRYQDGDRLYLNHAFTAAAVAGAVEASAGYDRSLFTRDAKFGDAAGHRGFAYMPDRNLLFEPLEVQQEVSTRKK